MRLIPMLTVLLVVTACGDSADKVFVPGPSNPPPPPPSLSELVREVIDAQGLTGNPAEGRNIPQIGDPLPQLGMQLFFSKGLGGQNDAACVTCHHPLLGGGDNLSLPIGVDADVEDLLGPGRVHSSAGHGHDGGPTVPRNSPTTFNVALWDAFIFHDGRIESLGKTAGANGADGQGIRTPDVAFGEVDPQAQDLVQAQVLFPVTSREEMRGLFVEGEPNQVVRDSLVARWVEQSLPNTWEAEFQVAFGSSEPAVDLVTYANVTVAIAAYESSQVFVNTPWRAFVEGDDAAISNSAKRGALLFYGEGGCVACHSGDLFSDEQFHVLAMPQFGRGKGDGVLGDDDFGRFRETGVESDLYAFRTSSLLNVVATGPFTHAGAYPTLEGAIRHHLDPAQAIDGFDFTATELQPGIQAENAETNTRLALAQLQSLMDSGESALTTADLSDQQVSDLLAFVESLTDPCVLDAQCLAPWIPERTGGPDNLRQNGFLEDGTDL